MENTGVKCDVAECLHNKENYVCQLACIEVTHQKTGADAVATPHFCKSYQQK